MRYNLLPDSTLFLVMFEHVFFLLRKRDNSLETPSFFVPTLAYEGHNSNMQELMGKTLIPEYMAFHLLRKAFGHFSCFLLQRVEQKIINFSTKNVPFWKILSIFLKLNQIFNNCRMFELRRVIFEQH